MVGHVGSAFREGLRERGYVEGRNVVLEMSVRGRKAGAAPRPGGVAKPDPRRVSGQGVLGAEPRRSVPAIRHLCGGEQATKFEPVMVQADQVIE